MTKDKTMKLISMDEWMEKKEAREVCPCTGHSETDPVACEICRGACSCHWESLPEEQLQWIVIAMNAEFKKLGTYPIPVEERMATYQRIKELTAWLEVLIGKEGT